MHSVVLWQRHDVGLCVRFQHVLPRLALHDNIAAELAGENDERSVQHAALLQVEDQLGHRPVDGLLHSHGAYMAIFVSVPEPERNVFGRDFNEARACFGQTASQQTAKAELAGVIDVEALLRFQRQVKGLGRGRTEQTMSPFHRSQQRLLLKTAAMLQYRIVGLQFPVSFVAAMEAGFGEPGRRADARSGIVRVVNQKRSIFRAKKTGSVECLHGVALRAQFQILADVEERRNVRMPGPERACEKRAHVRHQQRLRRGVSGVPVILMLGVQNLAQVADAVGANQRAAVHHLGDLFQAL